VLARCGPEARDARVSHRTARDDSTTLPLLLLLLVVVAVAVVAVVTC